MTRTRDRETTVIDDPALDRASADAATQEMVQQEQSFLELLLHLPQWRPFIFKAIAACTITGIVIALVWPKSFTAVTRIMPPQQSQSQLAAAMMGQLGSFASLASSTLGMHGNSDVYVYMLHSRSLADTLIQRFNLMSVYRSKRLVDAEDKLRDNSEISSGREGGISISVVDSDPQRAADIANNYVAELKKLTQTLAVTEAGRRRIFFEHEVQQAMDDLSKAELGMKKTQEETGILMLEPQSRAMLEGIAGLHAQVAVKEAQVQAMRSFATDENPDLKRAESELGAMRSELSRLESGKVGDSIADIDLRKIPEKGLAYVRALRELKYREAVYEAMTKQYEIARVDEAKDATIIQVLDKAVPPEVRTSPKRTLIVVAMAFVGLFLSIAIALLVERGRQQRRYSEGMEALKSRLLRSWRTKAANA